MTRENEEEERAASSQMATDSLWPEYQSIKKNVYIYMYAYTQTHGCKQSLPWSMPFHLRIELGLWGNLG